MYLTWPYINSPARKFVPQINDHNFAVERNACAGNTAPADPIDRDSNSVSTHMVLSGGKIQMREKSWRVHAVRP
jgi:hypothetical protein